VFIELHGIGEEVIMVYFKVLSWFFLGGAEEIHEIPQSV
jgi:hypothetical protein